MDKICANPECGKVFTPNAHNAKYCSSECRRVVTNKRVLERYHKSKEKKTEKRVCRECKKTVLSIYNPENICAPCKAAKLNKKIIQTGISEELLETMYEIARKNR